MRPAQQRSPARRAAALGLLAAALALAGCAPSGGEMGARYGDPAEALAAALGPGGWLGPLEQVALHAMADAPESRVALYSARRPDGAGWLVGVADAKRAWDGWSAHGRIGALSPPALAGALSCARTAVPAGGAAWEVLVGRFDPASVAAVELLAADGSAAPAPLRDDIFAALLGPGQAPRAVRALDAAGAPLAELPVAACQAP